MEQQSFFPSSSLNSQYYNYYGFGNQQHGYQGFFGTAEDTQAHNQVNSSSTTTIAVQPPPPPPPPSFPRKEYGNPNLEPLNTNRIQGQQHMYPGLHLVPNVTDSYQYQQQQQHNMPHTYAAEYGGENHEDNQEYYDYDCYYDSYNDGNGNKRGKYEEKIARKSQSYYCDVCNVSCTGEQCYQAHLEGKSHKRKATQDQGQSTNTSTQPKKKYAYHCKVCNVDCSGQDVYAAHVSGQKHQKAIKLLMKANKPIPTDEVSVITPATSTAELKYEKTNGQKNTIKRSVDINNRNNPKLICSVLDDELILERITRIGLDDKQNNLVEQLALFVEDTLFNVSTIIESSRANKDQSTAPLLRGLMRVGLLANRLLLKNDRRIDLIVLCSQIPTVDLLFQVIELFRQVINQSTFERQQIQVSEIVEHSAFTVTRHGIPIIAHVTLTCSLMRQWSPGDSDYYSYAEPENALPKLPCQNALAQMRRTKYFQIKCEPHPSAIDIIKIVRDFANRIPAWNKLNEWVIILIVERVISSNPNEVPLSPGAVLKALFLAISDGRVLSADSTLQDPCEKKYIDTIAFLSPSDRNLLFSSARYALRQINTNGLAKLLALDGSPGIPSEPRTKKKRIEPVNLDSQSVTFFS